MTKFEFINTITVSDYQNQEKLIQACINAENYGADAILFFLQSSDEKQFCSTITKLRSIIKIPYYISFEKKETLNEYKDVRSMDFVSKAEKNYPFADIVSGEFFTLSNDDTLLLFKPDNLNDMDIKELCSTINIKQDIFCKIGILLDISETLVPFRNLFELKYYLKQQNYDVNDLASTIAFSDFKLNSDYMLPVIVQDYQTNEVLMLAYMNQESFEATLRTGHMTYFSRSRQELWEKGLTSGHFQYVKDLFLDCDNDTILAKVYQVGAACHTGKRSCFFKHITTI